MPRRLSAPGMPTDRVESMSQVAEDGMDLAARARQRRGTAVRNDVGRPACTVCVPDDASFDSRMTKVEGRGAKGTGKVRDSRTVKDDADTGDGDARAGCHAHGRLEDADGVEAPDAVVWGGPAVVPAFSNSEEVDTQTVADAHPPRESNLSDPSGHAAIRARAAGDAYRPRADSASGAGRLGQLEDLGARQVVPTRLSGSTADRQVGSPRAQAGRAEGSWTALDGLSMTAGAVPKRSDGRGKALLGQAPSQQIRAPHAQPDMPGGQARPSGQSRTPDGQAHAPHAQLHEPDGQAYALHAQPRKPGGQVNPSTAPIDMPGRQDSKPIGRAVGSGGLGRDPGPTQDAGHPPRDRSHQATGLARAKADNLSARPDAVPTIRKPVAPGSTRPGDSLAPSAIWRAKTDLSVDPVGVSASASASAASSLAQAAPTPAPLPEPPGGSRMGSNSTPGQPADLGASLPPEGALVYHFSQGKTPASVQVQLTPASGPDAPAQVQVIPQTPLAARIMSGAVHLPAPPGLQVTVTPPRRRRKEQP